MKITTTNGRQETIVKFLKQNLTIKTKQGFEWQALCPYHEDSNPSFSVNIRKGLFICYACGAKGNMEQLAEHLNTRITMEADYTTFEEVIETIEKLLGSEYQVTRPIVGIPYPEKYKTEVARERTCAYFNGRGISHATVVKYRLGFDLIENDAIIPLSDMQGRIAGFIKRTLDKQRLLEGAPKYRYPKGLSISKYLFGSDVVKEHLISHDYLTGLNGRTGVRRFALVITEGSVDAMSVHGCFPNTFGVAILGSRMSKEQAQQVMQLAPDLIIIATDRDRAGREAEIQVKNELDKLKMGIKIVCAEWHIVMGKDINELEEEVKISILQNLLEG